MTSKRARDIAFTGIVLIAAAIWIFPMYWALTTSLRSEARIISDAGVLIDELNFSAFIDVLSTSKLPLWYLNSVGTSAIITAIVLLTGMMCAYALSQLRFPGRQTLYLPLNWGITAALAIITFISAWNNFFWPFLVVTSEDMMTIPVGITQVNDAFGVAYARMMALALLAAAPVIIGYLIFQNRVTEAVMISAGVKG